MTSIDMKIFMEEVRGEQVEMEISKFLGQTDVARFR